MQCQKPKLFKASSTRRRKAIKDMEKLGMKGLKVALILAQLGDTDPLARLLVLSELIVGQGQNLIRAIFPDKHRGSTAVRRGTAN